MIVNLCRWLLCGLLLALLVTPILPAPAGADVVAVISRGEIASDAYLDWGDLGPSSAFLNAPFTLSSYGTPVTAIIPFGSYQRVDQGVDWPGNFAPGDKLLRTITVEPLFIEFTSPVAGWVAQIQGENYGSFYGVLNAWDSIGTNIYEGYFGGQSTAGADGSAVIFGILSDLANIKSISFNVEADGAPVGGPETFALNRMDLQTTAGSPVPVPPAFWLLGSGLLAMAGLRLKKR